MSKNSGKILFAGGGTGGHVYPALACIEALQRKGEFQFLYVGGYRGIENSIIPLKQLKFKKIWISGLQRYFTLKNLLFPLKVVVSLLQSLFILLGFKPQVVVGTGGYVSGPVVYTASKLGIPTLIQEHDSYPGVTTRILARYADYICVPYETVREYFAKRPESVLVYGVPVRNSLQITDKKQAVKTWDLKPDQPVILVFGGSQGAQALNLAIREMATYFIQEYQVQWLWQTGKKNIDEVRAWPVASEERVVIVDYVDAMDAAYSAADIIISRAGAITLAELSMAQKPCILVPYPHAAANHQEKNARTIANLGAAILVKEGRDFIKELREAVSRLLSDRNYASTMGKKWKEVSRPDAAGRIADHIIKMMKA